jgi:hypothetical protein
MPGKVREASAGLTPGLREHGQPRLAQICEQPTAPGLIDFLLRLIDKVVIGAKPRAGAASGGLAAAVDEVWKVCKAVQCSVMTTRLRR